MTDYRDNIEIDLRDLLRVILLKWKLLILAAVVGCAVGALYAGRPVEIIDEPEPVPALTKVVTEQDVAALAMKLSVKEKSDADLAFEAYKKTVELNDQIDSLVPEAQVELMKATQQILAAGNAFTADQKAYYAALFATDPELSTAAQSGVAENAGSTEQVAAPTQAASTGSSAKSLLKFGAIGAFAGLFVVALIIALKYILTPVLKTEDDLRTAFRLPIIGTIKADSDNDTALIYSGIAACAGKAEAKKLYLVSSSEDELITSNRTKMSGMFEGKDVSVIAKGSMLTEPSVIDEIVNSDGVILFERIGKSLYEDIAREVELCGNYGVPVIGTVVIK